VVQRRWYLLIIGLALFLRFSLVLVNREANDAHEAVAKIIAQTDHLPQKDDCWECFQPKLFHLSFAVLLRVFGMVNNPGYQQNVLGELANFAAATITLIVVLVFIERLAGYDEKLKLLAFSLVALNPALIGINSQATNDTFVILFSTLAIFSCYQFFRSGKTSCILYCALFSVLAISSKTNGWVTVLAILAALLLWCLHEGPRLRKLTTTFIFLVTVVGLSVVNPLNQYIPNIRQYGAPILMNLSRDPLPRFSGPYPPGANGIWYTGDGYLTFRFFALLRHPRLERHSPVYLPHQTSFWTVLFARANSIHFDNAPPSWSTQGAAIFPLLRLSLSLALLPTALLLFGGFRELYRLLAALMRKGGEAIRATHYGLFVFVFFGYLAFELFYSLEYRSVTVIKAIFVFPALLSFPILFMGVTADLYAFIHKAGRRWVTYLLDSAIIALLVCYVIDVAILIVHLSRSYLQHHPLL
jgi:hypothetical protein